MASLNTVLLMGNLTRDPEIRYTTSGAAVCNFGIAMNSRFTTAQGEVREEVCFVDVEVWGKQAESLQRYKRKGESVFVEGRLKTDSWQDRDTNQKRSRLSVRADRIQFIGSANREGGQGGAPQDAYPGEPQIDAPPQQVYQNSGYAKPAPQAQGGGSYNNRDAQYYAQQRPNATMPAAPSFNAPIEPANYGNNDFNGGARAPIFETIDEPEDDIPF